MNDEQQLEERRHFSRILFNAECTLHQNDMEWPTEVLDISLKGLLVHKPDHFSVDLSKPCEATIKLAGSDSYIVMSLLFSHEDERSLGFRCEYIDLDSMTHLKRLVELNLGSEDMLKRELDALTMH
ncbi:MAG: PilZ domain-containing protein [Oleiphilaceae bacterium]|nr:PilZ domain-containing protein [Oleiphilaceae bacterium]